MTTMTAKMQSVYNDIKCAVEFARSRTYEEWLAALNMKDHPVLFDLYGKRCNGIINEKYDGRTLSALQKRGLIYYSFDDKRGDWMVVLL